MLNNGKLGSGARPAKAGRAFSAEPPPQRRIALRQHLDALPAGPERLQPLRQAIGDVAAFQRAGHAAARLQLDREKLEHRRQKHRDALAPPQTKGQERRDLTRH